MVKINRMYSIEARPNEAKAEIEASWSNRREPGALIRAGKLATTFLVPTSLVRMASPRGAQSSASAADARRHRSIDAARRRCPLVAGGFPPRPAVDRTRSPRAPARRVPLRPSRRIFRPGHPHPPRTPRTRVGRAPHGRVCDCAPTAADLTW